jgi:hypothetical protein
VRDRLALGWKSDDAKPESAIALGLGADALTSTDARLTSGGDELRQLRYGP